MTSKGRTIYVRIDGATFQRTYITDKHIRVILLLPGRQIVFKETAAMALSEPTSPMIKSLELAENNDRRWHHRFSKWFGRDDGLPISHEKDGQMKPSLGRRLSRKVVPGIPRPPTFRRQISEKRDRLMTVDDSGDKRRAQSLDRRRTQSLVPSSPINYELSSLPVLTSQERTISPHEINSQPNERTMDTFQPQIRPMPPSTPPAEADDMQNYQLAGAAAPPNYNDIPGDFADQINHELEDKWILNLSMHFRDNSPREKFFVTYAEMLTKWRRLTVSCDYRDAPPESLERDLQAMMYQRDKNARIYEAIRNSLPDIQFYETVTNLRLETGEDDRLHVHVTEDVNEVILYPSTSAVKHLDYARVDERDVAFDSHMSGFVYKVRVNNATFNGKICVKKEIPGPDSVEEFLYEINALNALVGTSNVVQFEGLVVDEENELVKGLLISYANQGPLVDLIFDFKGTGSLSWDRKAKWARQMTYGLSAIHEAGFVQGDCTLSNIVIDQYDDALIIDINRRGCPVGWEPPEIHNMIDNGHRISMYIGVKSDLFQLGMSLWALLFEEDEPERQTRPLNTTDYIDIPKDKKYLLDITKICLSEKPRDRLSAEKLLSFFPREHSPYPIMDKSYEINHNDIIGTTTYRDTVYINPDSNMEENVPSKHFHHFRNQSESSSRRQSISTNSEDDMRGRRLPRGLPYSSRESALDMEPLVVSISPTRDTKFSGNLYGLDIDEDDEEAAQRVVRRRQRMRGLESHSEHNKALTLDHIDSGLDGAMHIDTSDIVKYARGLDHVDSGLADMDIGHINSNDLARRRIELQEIDDKFNLQPRSHEDINTIPPNDQDITAIGLPLLSKDSSISNIDR